MFLVRIRSRDTCVVVDSQTQAPSVYLEGNGHRSWMSGFLCGGRKVGEEVLRNLPSDHGESPSYEGGFAVIHSDGDAVFISRDRDGLYPLYYCRHEGDWLFSDSISCIAQCSGLTEVDPTALGRFFAYDAWNSDFTLLLGIKMIPAGSTWKLLKGQMVEISQYEVPYTELEAGCKKGYQEIVNDILGLLNRYIEQIESACSGQFCNLLSGGVDSSLFQALLSGRGHCRSFCATYEERGCDGAYARSVAKYLDTDLTVKVIDRGVFESRLAEFIEITESPFVNEGEVMVGTLFDALPPDITVGFHCNGTGALFGGRTFLRLAGCLGRLPKWFLRQLVSRCVPEIIRETSRLASGEETPGPRSIYAFCNSVKRVERAQQLVPEFAPERTWGYEIGRIRDYSDDPVERLRRLEAFHFSIQEENSIRFRLATRRNVYLAHPFMDPGLRKYVLSIPLERLCGLLSDRKVEKIALRRFLPRKLVYRKKVGKRVDFPGLWMSSSWFRGLIEEIRDSKYEFLGELPAELFLQEIELAKKLIAFHIWYKRVRRWPSGMRRGRVPMAMIERPTGGCQGTV